MKQALLVALALLAACRGAASEEKSSQPKANATIEPIALSDFERGAPVTLQRVQTERQTRDLEDRAKRALESYLFDPFSMRVRSVRAGRNGAICGQVNAKNRMGAYVGFKDFVVSRDRQRIWMSSYNNGLAYDLFSDFAEAYANACASSADANRYRAAHAPYYEDYDPEPYIPSPTDRARDDFYNAEIGGTDMNSVNGL
ncbi:hypothetical protein [Allosphingosinicella sp.]|jgi:hypothetical protein|uniref:hypothetical protein n=1 Tax=Allosphingosinicella sp. TaxID=2823234 RepID=UPI002F1C3830